MKQVLVCGAGGFIGTHLVRRLRREGHWVRGVDLREPEYSPSQANEFRLVDLREPGAGSLVFDRSFDEVYQLAADMGGAGYIFTGENDARIMHASALINLNVIESCRRAHAGRVFFSSSACIYPEHAQRDPHRPDCREAAAYPANPDSEYGWEKLFSERLYESFSRNYGLPVRIARLHNVFGEEGAWQGGREKAPAALCRKVAEASDGGSIEVWGDGGQTRSFLHVEECVEGILRLMRSEFPGPVNLGSEEKISIEDLARLVMDIAGKRLRIEHVPGPQGVRGRTSDNTLLREKLGWAPSRPLREGLERTYAWVEKEMHRGVATAVLADRRLPSVSLFGIPAEK